MNIELFPLFLALLAGLGLGFCYFGGLWLTVQYLPVVRYPAVFIFGSFVARVVLCLGGFYVVMAGSWERLSFCLLGFLFMRQLLVRRWGQLSRTAVGV